MARLIPLGAGVGFGVGPYGSGLYGEGTGTLLSATTQHHPLYCSDLDPLLCSDELECSDAGGLTAATAATGTLVPA